VRQLLWSGCACLFAVRFALGRRAWRFSLVLAFSTTRAWTGVTVMNAGRGPEDSRKIAEGHAVGPMVPTISPLAAPNVVNVSVQSPVLIADGWFVGRLGRRSWRRLAWSSPRRPRCR